MIDLRGALGAIPIVYNGAPTPRIGMPSGQPYGAPLMPINQVAQTALGCVGCSKVPQLHGLGAIDAGWWSKYKMPIILSAAGIGIAVSLFFVLRGLGRDAGWGFDRG